MTIGVFGRATQQTVIPAGMAPLFLVRGFCARGHGAEESLFACALWTFFTTPIFLLRACADLVSFQSEFASPAAREQTAPKEDDRKN